MKTSQWIAALAADAVPEPVDMGRRFATALAIGLAGALALYAFFVGPRPDFAEAVRTVRFDLKFLDATALALPSLFLLFRLARPDARLGALALWLFAPLVLLAAAVAVELTVVPSSEWLTRLVGDNWMYCSTMIPDDGGADPGGAHRGDAGRRAAASGLDGRARGCSLRGARGAPLCIALPGRFTALRGHLVSVRNSRLRCGRRAGGATVSRLVSGRPGGRGDFFESYFFTSGSRIALSWSIVSSPP